MTYTLVLNDINSGVDDQYDSFHVDSTEDELKFNTHSAECGEKKSVKSITPDDYKLHRESIEPILRDKYNKVQTSKRQFIIAVGISEQEQNAYNNITSKYNSINDYLSEITNNMKLLENVRKHNVIKINNMRIETIQTINDRFSELIKESDSQIFTKQNQLSIDRNQLKRHKDDLQHFKSKYHTYISDDKMNPKQRKCKILQMNNTLLSKDIAPTAVIPKVKISFDKDLTFQHINNIGSVRNYLSPNPPIFSIKHIFDASATVEFSNLCDAVEPILEIAAYDDIGDDEVVTLNWQQMDNFSINFEVKECNIINITELKDNTNYSVRARYKNRYGLSEYSEIKNFKIISINFNDNHESEYDEYDIDNKHENSVLKLADEDDKSVASVVSLQSKLKGGAVIIDGCRGYTFRVYMYFILWQVPMMILNIILFCIWSATDDVITELGFIAVGPVLAAALIRDNLCKWCIYWIVQNLCCYGCGQAGRYHFSRFADCIGGLHASLGVTALTWNIIYFTDILKKENYQTNVITVTAGFLPALLSIICISAAPSFRYYYHDSFESLHRYLNWLSLFCLLVHVFVINKDIMFEYAVTDSPALLAAALTILTIYPWIIMHRLRGKDIEIIPAHTGTSTALILPIWAPMGAVCKLSLNWVEFHVFGITPLPYDKDKGHRSLVLIKDLGDWTNHLTTNAKNDQLNDRLFWVHRVKPPNFSRGLFNFKKVFALVTGVGIAPLLPYVVNPQYLDVAISLVWVARDHGNNYPQFIVDLVKPLPNVILYDTTKRPRCDLSLLTLKKAQEFQAEAVFIVSNPKTAYNVSNYINKKGIPVFASNFDV